MCMCVCACVCMCMCVYVHVYVCMCVHCVCVYVNVCKYVDAWINFLYILIKLVFIIALIFLFHIFLYFVSWLKRVQLKIIKNKLFYSSRRQLIALISDCWNGSLNIANKTNSFNCKTVRITITNFLCLVDFLCKIFIGKQKQSNPEN